MKKILIAANAFLLVFLLASPAAWAGSAVRIEQTGNGAFTVLNQGKAVTYKNMPQQKIDKLVPFITRDRVPTTGKMGGRGCAPGFMQGGVNNAATYQSGFGNTATIKQTGTGNQAVAVQDGNNNKSYIVQRGNGNLAETVQVGNNNTAVILQRC